ncbi:MAG: hypothetical protein ACFFCV_06530 [Promethearchaeota archaeon]
MDEIKTIIDDLGIAALEANVNLAALAVISDSGKLIIQTENWDLTNQEENILNIIKGISSFTLSNVEYSVVEVTKEGIIGTNVSGMGHVLLAFFHGGVLVAYAMPRADPPKALAFLKNWAIKLNGII